VLAEQRDPDRVARDAVAEHGGQPAVISYPLVVDGVESYLGAREALVRDGYRRLLVDGRARDLDELRPTEALALGGRLDVVVDRLTLSAAAQRRVAAGLEAAWSRAEGHADLFLFEPTLRRVPALRGLSCPRCARAFEAARPGLFSYQSPVGACPTCRGFGRVLGIDWNKVVPDPSRSLAEGCIRPWAWAGKKATWERRMLRQFCEAEGIDLHAPWSALTAEARERVLEGEGKKRRRLYPGVRAWFRWLETKVYKMHVRVLLSRYRSYDECPRCRGKRLSEASLMYRVGGIDLGDWHQLELRRARERLEALSVGAGQGAVAKRELSTRLAYLERVGLGYLTLDRQARTLSGGEAQRVSLTAALGTSLTGAMFVLDEPTVGLHPSDVEPLIACMRDLADRHNVVVVVEHDARVIAAGSARVQARTAGAWCSTERRQRRGRIRRPRGPWRRRSSRRRSAPRPGRSRCAAFAPTTCATST
jgi:excinuclease ABC subunit A